MSSFLSRLVLWLLLALSTHSAWGSWQYSGTVGDFTFTATYNQTAGGAYEGTATITGYTGTAANVVIPESVSFTANPSGQNVTVNCRVTAIQSGWGQPGVFADKAFITSVEIPQTVTSIGNASFYRCTGLTAIDVPASVTGIGESAFYECTALTILQLHEGLQSIDQNAFAGCVGITSVSIPSTLSYTGYVIFNGYNGPFTGCVNLTDVSIGIGADLGNGAFKGLTNLKNVTFTGVPDSANPGSIGNLAFRGCTNLININIPNGVAFIGQAAFMDCSGLKSVTIPSSITGWGNGAFVNCGSLNVVTLQTGLTSLGNATFVQCNSLESIDIPDGVTSIGNSTFAYCASLANIKIPNTVTRFEEGAFSGCGKLASINIPTSVTSFENSVFADCPILDNVVIPSSVTNMGGFTFVRCTGLRSINLSPNITSIGEYAFNSCSSLLSIALPTSVNAIGNSAFYNCGSLTSISIPSNVVSIGAAAFRSCQNLKSAFFLGAAPSVGEHVFGDSPATIYYLPGTNGFTSPTWQGYSAFIAAPYGGVVPNLAVNEAHLIGGIPANGDVRLDAAVTDAPLLWQRQTAPVTLDMETSRILRLGATGAVRIEAGYGGLTIGLTPGDGFLTAGGIANTPGTLVLDNASANDLTINAVIANNGSGAVALSKTGGGRAILNASNTYSGNTTITGGTLVLKSPCLANASAVTITTGGTLNLDYTGADIVSSLTLNGTPQPNGLYDSTNTNGLITGTGKIQVGPFADFTGWSAANAPGQTAAQDHDHDGVPNGIEYFMGASGSGFTANPTLINGTVTWPKSADFAGAYSVQTSTDLKVWTDVTTDPAQVTTTANSVIWTRSAGAESRFARLVVMPN